MTATGFPISPSLVATDQNSDNISDMSDESLSAVVVAEIENWPEAATVTANSLLHLGNRAAVDQAWSRLARGFPSPRLNRLLHARRA